jgi:hypothetical protein
MKPFLLPIVFAVVTVLTGNPFQEIAAAEQTNVSRGANGTILNRQIDNAPSSKAQNSVPQQPPKIVMPAKSEKQDEERINPPVVTVTAEGLVSVKAYGQPLNELLGFMSARNIFDIRGSIPSGEPITLNFTDLSINQALKKILRGYNYVLLDQSKGQKAVLMVMGKTDWSRPVESARPISPPQPSGQAAPDPQSYYVPPIIEDTAGPKAATIVPNNPRAMPQPGGLPAGGRGGYKPPGSAEATTTTNINGPEASGTMGQEPGKPQQGDRPEISGNEGRELERKQSDGNINTSLSSTPNVSETK